MRKSILLVLILLLILINIVNAEQLSPYPDSLDYRDYMGQNWMTSVKDQESCGSCWAFSALGAVEGVINLYYNQHLNVNLSEQQLVSNDGTCCGGCGDCGGGWPEGAFDYMKNSYVVLEDCFPYEADNVSCDICSNPVNNWSLNEFTEISSLEFEKTKIFLSHNGPGSITVSSWQHAMVVNGYTENNNLIIKNSYGSDFGDNGYVTMEFDDEDMFFSFPIRPYDQLGKNVSCTDNDDDGYCYWGKSNDTSRCDDDCVSYTNGDFMKDLDDNDASVNFLRNVWISGFNSTIDAKEKIAKINETQNISLTLSFIGENESDEISDLYLNFYVNNELYESIFVGNLSHRQSINISLNWTPIIFKNNHLKFEVNATSTDQETLGFMNDNSLELGVWVYNYEEGFEISENTVFDCEEQGLNPIIGPKTGIALKNMELKNNITIQNCNISSWYCGIKLESSNNSKIANNNIHNNLVGIYVYNSSNLIIENNNVMNSHFAIRLSGSSSNITIIKNSITGGDLGIWLESVLESNIINNTIKNAKGLHLGIYLHTYNPSELKVIDTNNPSELKVIDTNFINNFITADPGEIVPVGIGIVESHNNKFINNTINNFENGILLSKFSSNSYNYTSTSYNNTFIKNFVCNDDGFSFKCEAGNSTSYNFGLKNNFRSMISICPDGFPVYGEHYLYCNESWDICSDGTSVNSCSSDKPLFCSDGGDLVEDCELCGCPLGDPGVYDYVCNPGGGCEKVFVAPSIDCHNVSSFGDCESEGMCDANSDGVVNMSDVDHIGAYAAGNVDFCGFQGVECFCDISGDGSVSGVDASRLYQLLPDSKGDSSVKEPAKSVQEPSEEDLRVEKEQELKKKLLDEKKKDVQEPSEEDLRVEKEEELKKKLLDKRKNIGGKAYQDESSGNFLTDLFSSIINIFS